MVDAHNAARIVFNDAEVTADGVFGEVDQGGNAGTRNASDDRAVMWPDPGDGGKRVGEARPV